MSTYPTQVTTTAADCRDAMNKIKAYRTLYNIINSEVITFVKGTFRTTKGDLVFLNNYAGLVDINMVRLKWYDKETGKWISIHPIENEAFTLIITT